MKREKHVSGSKDGSVSSCLYFCVWVINCKMPLYTGGFPEGNILSLAIVPMEYVPREMRHVL